MKAAVIGLGRMGLRHLQVLRDVGVEIVAAVDSHAAARDNAAQQYGLPVEALFAEAGPMFAKLRPELVVVATTAPSHCELVCLAASHGARAILCEKPMATSVADCDRMIAACSKAGALLAINHQMRFMEQYVAPKRLVESEAFGGLASVTVVAGNFGIAMNGSHYFEMFRFMTGEMPAEVSAWFSSETVPNPRGPQFEDRAGSVRLTTASGKRFYMDAGSDHGHGMHITYAGRFGRLDVDELSGKASLVTRKPEHRNLATTRYGMPYDETDLIFAPADSVAPTKAVLEALLAGADYPDGTIGRMAVAVLAAAYASHEQGGRAVSVSAADLAVNRVFPWA
jgi:predicted dehydrogenase